MRLPSTRIWSDLRSQTEVPLTEYRGDRLSSPQEYHSCCASTHWSVQFPARILFISGLQRKVSTSESPIVIPPNQGKPCRCKEDVYLPFQGTEMG